jgi:hypothetical protein
MRDEQLLREVDRLATQRFMHVVAPPPNTGAPPALLPLHADAACRVRSLPL